jgi:hypothetical protein
LQKRPAHPEPRHMPDAELTTPEAAAETGHVAMLEAIE